MVEKPKIGIGVMILKQGRILLGQRIASHGLGEYAFPGGELEHGESFEGCAQREVYEETGIEIESIKFLRIYNQLAYLPKHYVNIAMIADWKSGEAVVKEPLKHSNWGWFLPHDLPTPLFHPVPSAVDAFRTGRYYY